MKKLLLTLLILALTLPVFGKVIVGKPAPDFTLPDIRTGQNVTLSSFKGQVVVFQLMKCQ